MGVPGTGAGRGLALRSRGAASAHAGLTRLQPAPTATPGSMKDRTQELRTVSPIPARFSPRAPQFSTRLPQPTGASTRGQRQPCKPGGPLRTPLGVPPLRSTSGHGLELVSTGTDGWGLEELFGALLFGGDWRSCYGVSVAGGKIVTCSPPACRRPCTVPWRLSLSSPPPPAQSSPPNSILGRAAELRPPGGGGLCGSCLLGRPITCGSHHLWLPIHPGRFRDPWLTLDQRTHPYLPLVHLWASRQPKLALPRPFLDFQP